MNVRPARPALVTVLTDPTTGGVSASFGFKATSSSPTRRCDQLRRPARHRPDDPPKAARRISIAEFCSTTGDRHGRAPQRLKAASAAYHGFSSDGDLMRRHRRTRTAAGAARRSRTSRSQRVGRVDLSRQSKPKSRQLKIGSFPSLTPATRASRPPSRRPLARLHAAMDGYTNFTATGTTPTTRPYWLGFAYLSGTPVFVLRQQRTRHQGKSLPTSAAARGLSGAAHHAAGREIRPAAGDLRRYAGAYPESARRSADNRKRSPVSSWWPAFECR